MKIRRATAGDIPSMMTLARASATAAHWTEQQYREMLSPAVTAHRAALVAEASPEPVSTAPAKSLNLLGFLVARLLAPECELENIVVSPAARRRGIGKQLLKSLLLAVRETNVDSVFLEVRESNHSARAFYENAGFKLHGRRKSYYSNPPENAVSYRLMVR